MEFRDGKFYQTNEIEVDINATIERLKAIQGQIDLLVVEAEKVQITINEAQGLVKA